MGRDLVDVLTTKSYVILVSGDPGVGKTYLALLACSKKESCTYITYSEPEKSLTDKLAQIDPNYKGSFGVVSMITGDPSHVYSVIMNGLMKGEIVVVDSINSMLYGVNEPSSLRTFIQLLYTAAKNKDGTLILLAEGPAIMGSLDFRYVSDAVVNLSYDEVLGNKVRKAEVIKDRSFPIEKNTYYFTISNGIRFLKEFSPESLLKPSLLQKISRPKIAEFELEKLFGYNILYEVDESIPPTYLRYFWVFAASDFVLRGYKVGYWPGPSEDKDALMSDFKNLLGSLYENVSIYEVPYEALGFDWKKVYNYIESLAMKGPKINIINLASNEELALKDPNGYEFLVENLVKLNIRLNRLAITYGYPSFKALRISAKYATAKRSLSGKGNYIFWKSLKPVSELYAVELDAEKGELNFVEVK